MNLKNHLLDSQSSSHPIVLDLTVVDPEAPTLLFLHGFKGFKDWGYWSLLEKYFLDHNYNFCKFNFSCNGTQASHLADFVDLDAFSINTFSRQCDEVKVVLNYLKKSPIKQEFYLMGHSLGGGIAITTAYEIAGEYPITKLITLASVGDLNLIFRTFDLNEWQQQGVVYVENRRTNQQMPLKYEIYQDYINQQERFNLHNSIAKLTIPAFIAHGRNDQTVSIEQGEDLFAHLSEEVKPLSEFYSLDSDHAFGGYHPWDQPTLTEDMLKVAGMITNFIER